MVKLYWKGYSHHERTAAISAIQEIVARHASIVDFKLFSDLELALVIEVDGGQHTPEADAARTAILQKRGLLVLRFWNNEVLRDLAGCAARILEVARERIASRYPNQST
mgnify:CR=1 FL=1